MALTGIYVLQEVSPTEIAAAPVDVKIVETCDDNGTAFAAEQVSTMTSGSGLVLGYFSLGEAEDYRSYFSSIPETILGPADPQWPGCYEVAYWTAEWLKVAKTEVTKLIEAGYDGAYFDVVDTFQTDWAQANAPGGDAAGAMKTLVEALSAYAKSLDADFKIWVNGAEELLTDETYLDAIDGMLKENLFYNSDGSAQISAEDTAFMLDHLHLATAAGKPVIDIEYVAGNAGKVADVYAKAAAAGLGIYVAELDLAGIDYADNPFISSSDDILDGRKGVFTLAGGLGDDTYITDGDDTITEDADAGTDTVTASASFVLGANLENLTLIGKAAINGTGNGLDNVIIGNAAANLIEGGAGNDTLTGGKGIDTASYADAEGPVTVSLAITAAQDTGGAGTDTLSGFENILGSAFADTLTGDAKANRIDGGAGADVMAGGAGNDIYIVDDTGDTVTELAKQGTDLVLASASFTLGGNVETLVLTGSGNINGTGNALANRITGNGGNNRLDGGAGADILAGGLGDDTYVVDSAKDVVKELAGQGTDTVEASINYMLGATLEKLVLTGAAIKGTGNTLDNTITGNDAANLLSGGAGADTLIGGGGDDTLLGGAGADTNIGGAGSDTVSYAASKLGVKVDLTEHVSSGGDAEGDTFDGIENLTGSAKSDDLNGDDAANRFDGGAGNDDLGGAAGNDVLNGGAGNDCINGGAGADILCGGAGADTLDYSTDTSGVSVTLIYGAAAWVSGGEAEGDIATLFENVVGGTGNDVLTGDSRANHLVGNDGDDILIGGAGSDTLIDWSGNNTFIGGAGADIMSGSAEGIDTVSYADSPISSKGAGVTVRLGSGGSVTVAAGARTDAAGDRIAYIDNIIGSRGRDTLTGNELANRLEGGAGADTLAGGGGADTFVFEAGFGNDRITDFGVADDVIQFDSDLFADYAAVLAAASQVGADTVIAFDAENTLTLANVEKSSLLLANFDLA
ncbi:endo alpha-1,4 polygalactosaminidase [Blastochloris sulfoviridis]|nr:endo alpha-1,4 polygalactosaminidase [Blastochloris sulfoviridis]